MAEFDYAQADLGKMIGKSRSHIANTLRLMKLPDSVKELLRSGQLSAGHGRALLAVTNPEMVAKLAVERGSSVRDLEKLSRQPESEQGEAHNPRQSPQKDADTRAIEKILEDQLGMTVSISHSGQGGELKIRYKTLDQLEDLCQRLRR